MTDVFDHDRCSELLRGFVLGELDRDEQRAVERHLEGCARCGAELRSLRTLLAPTDGLTRGERADLRARVTEVIDDRPASEATAHRWRRYQVVAAAAVIVLGIATFATLVPRLGGDDAERDALTTQPESFEDGGGEDRGGGDGGREPTADQPVPEPGARGAPAGGSQGTGAGRSEAKDQSARSQDQDERRPSNEEDVSSLAGRLPRAGIGARIGIVATR